MPLDSPSSTAARATPASEAHRAQLTAALAAGKGYQQRGAERAAECQQQLLLRGSDPKQRRAEDDGEAGAGVDPSRPGSASGLRVSVCISAPARPRATPASRPARVRGRRASSTIVQSAFDRFR